MQPVTADDVNLLLRRVETMLMPAEQRERLTAWLEAKRDALERPSTVWVTGAGIQRTQG